MDARKAALDSAKDRLAMELADAVTADGQTPEAEQVLAATDSSLEDLFQNNADPSEEEMEGLRLSALDLTERNAQDLLKQELVAQVKEFVRTQVAPELKERIAHEIETQTAPVIDDGLRKAEADDAAAHGGHMDPERAKLLAKAGQQAFDPALRQRVENRIREQAIPQAACRRSPMRWARSWPRPASMELISQSRRRMTSIRP